MRALHLSIIPQFANFVNSLLRKLLSVLRRLGNKSKLLFHSLSLHGQEYATKFLATGVPACNFHNEGCENYAVTA